MAKPREITSETLFEFAALLSHPFLLLQDPKQDKPPKQPCETEFKTKGRFRGNIDKELTLAAALTAILSAFADAAAKAKRFCELLSEDDCKKVKFVRYDFFDSDVTKDGDKLVATVELIIVWKCTK